MADETKRFEQSAQFLLEHARSPIFHLWEHGLKEGFVGGWVMSHRVHGEMAAQMARKILAGTPPGDIPVVYESPNRPMVNATAIARWHRITSYNVCYTKLLRNLAGLAGSSLSNETACVPMPT